MRRHELSDEEWAIIEPLLPKPPEDAGDHPPVHVRGLLVGFLLAQDPDDLFLAEPASLHLRSPFLGPDAGRAWRSDKRSRLPMVASAKLRLCMPILAHHNCFA